MMTTVNNIGQTEEKITALYCRLSVEDLKDKTEKEKLIRIARKRNPDIKIFQMNVHPEAFRLKEELINEQDL